MDASLPSMRDIASDVAGRFGYRLTDLTGVSRKQDVSIVRHMAMYLIYETGRYSYPQIGRFFNRDHTTVIHACRRHTERLSTVAPKDGRDELSSEKGTKQEPCYIEHGA